MDHKYDLYINITNQKNTKPCEKNANIYPLLVQGIIIPLVNFSAEVILVIK